MNTREECLSMIASAIKHAIHVRQDDAEWAAEAVLCELESNAQEVECLFNIDEEPDGLEAIPLPWTKQQS